MEACDTKGLDAFPKDVLVFGCLLPQGSSIRVIDLGHPEAWQLCIETHPSPVRLRGEGQGRQGCRLSIRGAAEMTGVTQTIVSSLSLFHSYRQTAEIPGNTFYFGNRSFLSFQEEIPWDF